VKYAVKLIDKDKIIEEDLSDNIKTEIQLMRMIRHPYIVKLCEVLSTQQKIILVMEYIEGGDLFDCIST
jgi:5'-AMP-activated protein kinase catalytic alpha subunit